MNLTKEDLQKTINGYEYALYDLDGHLRFSDSSDEQVEKEYQEIKRIRQRINELKEIEKDM